MATEDRRLLERAAQRAEERPAFIAFALAEFRRLRNLSTEELAQHLDADPFAVTRLALCLRPDGTDSAFREQVNKIAEHVGVNAFRLAKLLRDVDAQLAMQGTSANARLMAARQKPAESDESPAESPEANADESENDSSGESGDD